MSTKSFRFLVEIVADDTENAANIADRLDGAARHISPLKLAQILAASEPLPSRYNFGTGLYDWKNWRQR